MVGRPGFGPARAVRPSGRVRPSAAERSLRSDIPDHFVSLGFGTLIIGADAITRITFESASLTNHDLIIDSIGMTFTPRDDAVPEPGILGILGVGLLPPTFRGRRGRPSRVAT